MRNPFRSETEAFAFALGAALVGLATALAGALGNGWIALGVFLGLAAVLAILAIRRITPEPVERLPHHTADDGRRRVLVLANETVAGAELLDTIVRREAGRAAEILVVAPALSSRIRHWASDTDRALEDARLRLSSSLAALEAAGLSAQGVVGDDDPLQALEDALATFPADEVVIATHPPGRSHWLEAHVVERARARLAVPVQHVVVDLSREGLATA